MSEVGPVTGTTKSLCGPYETGTRETGTRERGPVPVKVRSPQSKP